MSLFDQRRNPPPTDSHGALASVTADTIAESIATLKGYASTARKASDAFSAQLSEAVANATAHAEELRAAHWQAADRQQELMRDMAKGAEASASFAQKAGGAKLDVDAVMKAAATETAKQAVTELGVKILGGPHFDNKGVLVEVLPSLAQRASEAGKSLEGAVQRAKVRWQNGAGRPENFDDQVNDERLKSVLESRTLESVLAFVVASLSGDPLAEKEWARLDSVARQLAVKKKDSSTSRRILEVLDSEVEARSPASIIAAGAALEEYRQIFRLLVAPNASFQTAAEYRARPAREDNGMLAAMLASWSVDSKAWGRFLAPRPFRLPGWSPVAFRDQLTGKNVRTGK